MPWRGPQYEGELPSLGWALLREWLPEYIPSPRDESKPIECTDAQASLILRWYAFDPDTGLFIYRRGAAEWAKGRGKSPILAVVSIAELCGPVLFNGWDASGEPVGVPWGYGDTASPFIQLAAVSEDQTENTHAVVFQLLTANDGRTAQRLGVDAGLTRAYLPRNRGKLMPVTASAGSREGQPITFAVLDETQLWLPTNGGPKLASTIRRNAAKMGGRTFETCNAPILGEKSVAEQTGKAAGRREPGIMFDAPRPTKVPAEGAGDRTLKKALKEVYGDAWWIDLERLLREIHDPETSWDDALRFYFNHRTPGGSKAVDPHVWDALRRPVDVSTREDVGLGFQGSDTSHAVLRACTREGYSWTLAAWTRPEGAKEWRVPRVAVTEAVRAAFDTYRVGLMFADPPGWRTEIDAWAAEHGEERVLALDTISPARFAPAVDRWLTAIREGSHTHDGDPMTDAHVKAAHLRKVRLADDDDDGRTRYVIVPGESGKRIGGAVADVLAHQAAMIMPEPPPREPLFAWA